MDGAGAELEELLLRAAIGAVLRDGIGDGLIGELVLQFQRGDGQSVDEEGEIERAPGLVQAVPELASNAEPVRPESPRGGEVPRRRSAVVEVDVLRTMLDALAQDIHHAALGDLRLQALQEARAGRPWLGEVERSDDLRLGGLQEGEELVRVDDVGAVEVMRRSEAPLGVVGGGDFGDAAARGALDLRGGQPGKVRDDRQFKALLGEISRGHVSLLIIGGMCRS